MGMRCPGRFFQADGKVDPKAAEDTGVHASSTRQPQSRLRDERTGRLSTMTASGKVENSNFSSFRRMPESSYFNAFWMPVQVRHDGVATFYEFINFRAGKKWTLNTSIHLSMRSRIYSAP
jgi:hypothetical protein